MEGTVQAPANRQSQRAAYRYMDAARFFAALAVVSGHAVGMVWGPPPPGNPMGHPWSWAFVELAGFGHQALMVFFVLSGFWISHSAMRLMDGDRFWTEFLTDRLSRLLIVLVPALGFGALLDVIGANLLHGSAYRGGLGLVQLADGVWSHLTPSVLAGNLLFLQGLGVPALGTNGPLWSIAFEFWYYVWFAALAVSIRYRRPSPALAALALGLIWHGLLYTFPVWLMGSVVYFADGRWTRNPGRDRQKARVLLGVGIAALIAVLAIVRLIPPRNVLLDPLVGLAFSLVLWGVLRDAAAVPNWLAPFARYGAGASYSLYAIHFPLFAFTLSAIGRNVRHGPDLQSFILIVALCVLAVAAGWIFSRLTEAHTARLRQAIRLRLRPASRG